MFNATNKIIVPVFDTNTTLMQKLELNRITTVNVTLMHIICRKQDEMRTVPQQRHNITR